MNSISGSGMAPEVLRQRSLQEKLVGIGVRAKLEERQRQVGHVPLPLNIPKSLVDRERRIREAQPYEKLIRVLILTSYSLYIADRWRKAIAMVRDSSQLQGRARHGIISDLSTEKKALQVCDTVKARIDQLYSDLPSILEKAHYHGQRGVEDNYELWAEMSDKAQELYAPALKAAERQFTSLAKKMIQPFDTRAFYTLLQLFYFTMVYTNYLKSFLPRMSEEERKVFRRFDTLPLAKDLLQWARLRDRDGKLIAFATWRDEDDIRKALATKPFYLKARSSEYRIFYLLPLFRNEAMTQVGYEIERAMSSFDNLSAVCRAAGFEPVDFQKLYRMKYNFTCMNTYEQYAVYAFFKSHMYRMSYEAIPRLRAAVPLWRGKPMKPCVGMQYNPQAKPPVHMCGVWMSAGEASREMVDDFMEVVKCVRYNDSAKSRAENLWESSRMGYIYMSLDRFEDMVRRLAEDE